MLRQEVLFSTPEARAKVSCQAESGCLGENEVGGRNAVETKGRRCAQAEDEGSVRSGSHGQLHWGAQG